MSVLGESARGLDALNGGRCCRELHEDEGRAAHGINVTCKLPNGLGFRV